MDPVFIIGGAPKCATTAIFDYLDQHPDIFVSEQKEPHYFASHALGRTVMQGNFTHAEDRDLFAAAHPGQRTGEGSTHYLHHAAVVAPLMAKEIPRVRLVFCLRNPVDRAYSHYLFRYSVAGPYDTGGVGQPRDFPAFAADPEIFAMGNYAANLEIFKRYFSDEQILLIFFEDIASDLAGCLARICGHMGVDPEFFFDLSQRSNETDYARYPALMSAVDQLVVRVYPRLTVPLRRRLLLARRAWFFSRDAAKERLAPEDRNAAREIYRSSIEQLAAQTGRDLSAWL